MPDFATGKDGRRYPIRNSPGYEYAFEGLSEKDKDYIRREYGGSYTQTADRAGRDLRVLQARQRREAGIINTARALAPLAQEHRFSPKYKSRLY